MSDGAVSCPADETPLDAWEDIVEALVHKAVEQSAEVVRLDRDRDDLAPYGGAAAVLRF